MFGSNVLDIGIGVLLTYLCLGLVVTASNELIATLFRSRSRDLERGIANMLDGTSNLPERWWTAAARWIRRGSRPQPGAWSSALFDHQLVNALSKDGERPSYIPSHAFAAALMHLVKRAADRNTDDPSRPGIGHADPVLDGLATFDQIRGAVEKIPNARIREAVLPLIEAARADMTAGVAAISKINQELEVWFDHTMDRVSGWYKRRTQWFLFGVALLTAVVLNVDTVAICRRLGQDDTLRAALVESAKQYTATARLPTTVPTNQTASANQPLSQSLNELQQDVGQLSGLGLPIGWTNSSLSSDLTKPDDSNLFQVFHNGPIPVVTKFAGLLLTAFAGSLGAPFWFDVLNKFMSVRGAGKAPEERPKDPKTVLQPQTP